MLADKILRTLIVFGMLLGAALTQEGRSVTQPVSFTYVDIIAPNATSTRAQGINNKREIVGGFVSDDYDGFVVQNGDFTKYDPYYVTWVSGVNSSGELAGYYFTGFGGDQAFVTSQGLISTLTYPGATSTIAWGINDAGDVVGQYFGSNSGSQGFLYSNGEFTTIDFPEATLTVAEGVNDSGDIAGYYMPSEGGYNSFVYKDGAFRQLVVPGCVESGASGINKLGDVVGYCRTGAATYGYLYKDGAFSFLSDPEAESNGILGTYAFGVNDFDDVVGYYTSRGSYYEYGFLATPAGKR